MLLLLLLHFYSSYSLHTPLPHLQATYGQYTCIRLLHMTEHGRKKLSKPALRPTRPAFYGQYYIQDRPHVPTGVHVCSMYHTAAHRRSLILYYYSTNYNNNCSNSAVQCNQSSITKTTLQLIKALFESPSLESRGLNFRVKPPNRYSRIRAKL